MRCSQEALEELCDLLDAYDKAEESMEQEAKNGFWCDDPYHKLYGYLADWILTYGPTLVEEMRK